MNARTLAEGRKPTTLETRYRMGAAKLGIDPQEYAKKRQAGLRWCFRCQAWQDKTLFGKHKSYVDGIDSQCQESARTYARERQRRLRQAAKQGK